MEPEDLGLSPDPTSDETGNSVSHFLPLPSAPDQELSETCVRQVGRRLNKLDSRQSVLQLY